MTAVGAALPLASVELYLKARGLTAHYPDANVVRGLGDAEDIDAVGAGRGIVISPGAGPGLQMDWAVDTRMVTLRIIGKQRDYDDGETFAGDVDRFMLADSNIIIGTTPALYIVRSGGGPTLIQVDKARRAHFSCSYIIPVASGL